MLPQLASLRWPIVEGRAPPYPVFLCQFHGCLQFFSSIYTNLSTDVASSYLRLVVPLSSATILCRYAMLSLNHSHLSRVTV